MRVAIIGLYNSGSSLLSQIMEQLGFEIGRPLWGNHFESRSLRAQISDWWDEPHMNEVVSQEHRIPFLKWWVEHHEARNPLVCANHPLLCLSAFDLEKAWGKDFKVIRTYRPLEESIAPLNKRDGLTNLRQSQQVLLTAVTPFFQKKEHHTVNYIDLHHAPFDEIKALVAYLKLKRSEAEIRKAAAVVRRPSILKPIQKNWNTPQTISSNPQRLVAPLSPKQFALAKQLTNQGNFEDALKVLEGVLKQVSDEPEVHQTTGICYMNLYQYGEAEKHFQIAATLQPNNSVAWYNLVYLYELKGDEPQLQETIKALKKLEPSNHLLDIRGFTYFPPFIENEVTLALYLQRFWEQTNEFIKQKVKFDLTQLVSQNWFFLLKTMYLDRDIRSIKEQLAKLFSSSLPNYKFKPKPRQRTRIRIGYLVTKGHENIFVRSMKGVINHLDSSKFEIEIVCHPSGIEKIKTGISSHIQKVHFLKDHLISNVIMIYDCGFDVLHFWEVGSDSMNYFLAFFRMATVQCTSWGVPGTSGLKTIDYYLSSKDWEPQNGQEHYTEQLVLFPNMPCYYYPPEPITTQMTLADYGLPTTANIYFVNQQLLKVQPDFDAYFLGILEKDPDGVIVFIEDRNPNLGQQVRQRIAYQNKGFLKRTYFMPKMELNKYLNLVALTDVILDPLVFSGANTTCDAFAFNVPVICLEGRFQRSRFTSAAYKQMGFEDCIVLNQSDYITKAIRLATDANYRDKIVKKIKQGKHRLWKDSGVIVAFEQFYEAAVTSPDRRSFEFLVADL